MHKSDHSQHSLKIKVLVSVCRWLLELVHALKYFTQSKIGQETMYKYNFCTTLNRLNYLKIIVNEKPCVS